MLSSIHAKSISKSNYTPKPYHVTSAQILLPWIPYILSTNHHFTSKNEMTFPSSLWPFKHYIYRYKSHRKSVNSAHSFPLWYHWILTHLAHPSWFPIGSGKEGNWSLSSVVSFVWDRLSLWIKKNLLSQQQRFRAASSWSSLKAVCERLPFHFQKVNYNSKSPLAAVSRK